MQRTYNVILRRCRAIIFAVEITVTYTEDVFLALGTQHGMASAILPSVALQYFSTLPQKRNDFREKKSY